MGGGRGTVDGSLSTTRETRESWYNDNNWTPECTAGEISRRAQRQVQCYTDHILRVYLIRGIALIEDNC